MFNGKFYITHMRERCKISNNDCMYDFSNKDYTLVFPGDDFISRHTSVCELLHFSGNCNLITIVWIIRKYRSLNYLGTETSDQDSTRI